MKKILLILFLVISVIISKAQDIHFSQLTETPLLLNPASTGVYDGYYRAILNYKSQWAAMGNPFRTFMGSFDMPLKNKKNEYGGHLGLGAYFFSDKAGDSDFGTTHGNFSVSGIVPISDFNTLSAGIEAGVSQRSMNFNAIQWPNQYNGHNYDPGLSSNEDSKTGSFMFFDMAAGAFYQLLKDYGTLSGKELVCFTAGVALFHVTRPLQRYYSIAAEHQYSRLVVHTSLLYDFPGRTYGMIPSLLYMRQGPASEIDAGMLLRFKISEGTKITGFISESSFSAGLNYRYKDAIIPQVFFELSDFSIGLSYDVTASSFSTAAKYNGGLEVSLKYSKMRGALYRSKW